MLASRSCICSLPLCAVVAVWLLVGHSILLQIHHGNGTQEIFYGDKRVLFVSIHRRDGDYYPEGCGFVTEVCTSTWLVPVFGAGEWAAFVF